MSTKAKNYLEWVQLAVTAILIPCIGYAVAWGGKIEDRIGDNETSIKLLAQDHNRDSAVDIDINTTLRVMANTTVDILQRLTKVETKIDSVQKSVDDHTRIDHTMLRKQ